MCPFWGYGSILECPKDAIYNKGSKRIDLKSIRARTYNHIVRQVTRFREEIKGEKEYERVNEGIYGDQNLLGKYDRLYKRDLSISFCRSRLYFCVICPFMLYRMSLPNILFPFSASVLKFLQVSSGLFFHKC